MVFDPNKVKPKIWATYIPSRSPNFKIHSCKAHAISALKCRAVYRDNYTKEFINEENKIYRLIDGKWIELDFEREYPRRQEGLVFK